jgi:hypothetical protein
MSGRPAPQGRTLRRRERGDAGQPPRNASTKTCVCAPSRLCVTGLVSSPLVRIQLPKRIHLVRLRAERRGRDGVPPLPCMPVGSSPGLDERRQLLAAVEPDGPASFPEQLLRRHVRRLLGHAKLQTGTLLFRELFDQPASGRPRIRLARFGLMLADEPPGFRPAGCPLAVFASAARPDEHETRRGLFGGLRLNGLFARSLAQGTFPRCLPRRCSCHLRRRQGCLHRTGAGRHVLGRTVGPRKRPVVRRKTRRRRFPRARRPTSDRVRQAKPIGLDRRAGVLDQAPAFRGGEVVAGTAGARRPCDARPPRSGRTLICRFRHRSGQGQFLEATTH